MQKINEKGIESNKQASIVLQISIKNEKHWLSVSFGMHDRIQEKKWRKLQALKSIKDPIHQLQIGRIDKKSSLGNSQSWMGWLPRTGTTHTPIYLQFLPLLFACSSLSSSSSSPLRLVPNNTDSYMLTIWNWYDFISASDSNMHGSEII